MARVRSPDSLLFNLFLNEASAHLKLYELGSLFPVELHDISLKDFDRLSSPTYGVVWDFELKQGTSQMQKYMYEKAMAQETRNGGTSTLNNNNGVDNSKKKLLIALDIFCLLLGKFTNKFVFTLCGSHQLICSRRGCCFKLWFYAQKSSNNKQIKQDPRFLMIGSKSLIVLKVLPVICHHKTT